MGLLRKLAEVFEGKKLYSIEEIPLPEKPSIIVILGESHQELKKVLKYWNEETPEALPPGTILTGREVTVEEIKKQ